MADVVDEQFACYQAAQAAQDGGQFNAGVVGDTDRCRIDQCAEDAPVGVSGPIDAHDGSTKGPVLASCRRIAQALEKISVLVLRLFKRVVEAVDDQNQVRLTVELLGRQARFGEIELTTDRFGAKAHIEELGLALTRAFSEAMDCVRSFMNGASRPLINPKAMLPNHRFEPCTRPIA